MKNISIVILVVLLMASIGFLWQQNAILNKEVKTLSQTIKIKDRQIQESEKVKQTMIDEYKRNDDSFYLCRYSREEIAQKAVKEGARLKDIEEIVAIYELTCKSSK